MANDIGVIDRFLNVFSAFIDSGFGLIQGDVFYLTSALIVISLTMAALFWAFDEGGNVLVPFIRKVLAIGFFAYLLNDWQRLSETIAHSFTRMGLKAAGDPMTVTDFFRPGAIAQKGVEVVDVLLQQIADLSGPIAFFENIGEIIIISLAVIAVLFSFFMVAIQVLVTILEFKIVTLAAFVVVPFALFSKTTFLAERALGYIPSAGLKLMTLALIVAIGSSLFNDLTPGTDPNIGEALSICLGSLVLMALALFAPSLAGSMVSGGPSLGAGTAATTALMGAGAVAGAGFMAAQGVAAGASGINSVRRASMVPQIGGKTPVAGLTNAAAAAFPSHSPSNVQTGGSAATTPAQAAAGVNPASAAALPSPQGGSVAKAGMKELGGFAKRSTSKGMSAVMSGDNSGGMTATNIGEKEE